MPKPTLWQDMKKTFLLHAIAAHFSNGIIPVAVLYLLLALQTGNPFFEHTVQHLLWITVLAIPVSFFSGIHDWKTKYRAAKAPIFTKKIRLSGVLFVLCTIGVALRLLVPGVMERGDLLHWIYVADLFGMFPVVTLLGHYGGKLSQKARQQPPKSS